jgi:arylsulfatase A-like enzyme
MLDRTVLLRAILALVVFAESAVFAAAPPNFIIFYTDDQGYADTSVRMMKDRADTGSEYYQTPHLERLAKEGMVFSHAYSPAPTCTPSRISIQFGKTTARIGQTTVHDVVAKKRGIDCKDERSLAHILKDADKGYVTAHFGKGMAIRRMEDAGYDVTDEYDIGDNGNFHGDYVSIKNKVPLPADDPKRVFSLTRSATGFIEKQAKAEKPFFMMVSHYAVHVKHAALAETIEKYRKLPRGPKCQDDDYIDPAKMSEGKRTCAWALQYAALIEHVDDSLGAIMASLDKTGLADNTYVIFTSDNGGGFKENGPLTGGKAKVLEGGLRVPTVVRGPGVLADAQCDVPVVQWDILSTLHDLSGSKKPLPANIDGGSWRDVLENGNKGQVKRLNPFLVFHYPYYAGVPISAIRLGDYKFMRQLNTGEERLHNVVRDLSESKNLIKDIPEKAAAMAKQLDDYLKEVNAHKIEDVYATRFRELEGYKARVKKDLPKERHEKEFERLDKQIQNTKNNQKRTEWF